MTIWKEEIFGPILCVSKVPFNSDREAVRAPAACPATLRTHPPPAAPRARRRRAARGRQVRLANASDFALGSCCFSATRGRANRIVRQLEAGMVRVAPPPRRRALFCPSVWCVVYAHECPTVVTKCASLSLSLSLSLSQGAVNDLEGTSYLSQSLPFGGCKFTGFGRFAGPEGLRGLSRTKAVVEDRFLLSGGTLMPYPPEVSLSLSLSPSLPLVLSGHAASLTPY
jgi:hypothetical protein